MLRGLVVEVAIKVFYRITDESGCVSDSWRRKAVRWTMPNLWREAVSAVTAKVIRGDYCEDDGFRT